MQVALVSTVLPKGPTPFGATQIHSYTRMASLIKTQQSDLFATRSRHFRRGNLWDTTVPQEENLPSCAPSGLKPKTFHILGLQHRLVHHGLTNSATKECNDMPSFL